MGTRGPVTVTGVGSTQVIPVKHHAGEALPVRVDANCTNGTYHIEHTADNVLADGYTASSGNWQAESSTTVGATSIVYTSTITGVRGVVTVGPTAVLTITVSQPGD